MVSVHRFVLAYFCIWGSIFIISCTTNDDSEINMDTIEIVKKEGYPGEYHEVVTEDGYFLTMHRIPYSPKSPAAPNKPAVLIQHGIADSSFSWIALGPNNSLGYLLADEGYDVWLGNARGNAYSRKHVTLSPDNDKFWDFSFHEIGVFDLAAEFDYILNTTKQQTVFYLGFSLGTTVFFVFISVKPEYNDKVKLMIAEAPAVLVMEDSGSFLTWPPALENSGKIISHASGGISMKMLIHYVQIIKSGKFQKYDYGHIINKEKYNQTTPPEYNLTAVTAPVALFYAPGDRIINPKDVFWLNKTLPQCIEVYRVPKKSFRHDSFTLDKDIRILVNDKVIELFKSY